jgi:hypothetical protein
VSDTRNSQRALTTAQREVFDNLLAVGGSRPVSPPALVSELSEMIEQGCAVALAKWPENRLWFGKSQLSAMQRCEGAVVAQAAERTESSMSPSTAVGTVAHRAIQIAHTHSHLTPAAAVDAAIEASREEERFAEWWSSQSVGLQSDLLCQMISRAVGFLDAFPPLAPNWVPRFEESIQVRLGGLVMSARPDLVLGRPRPDMRQTMFLCDFKTGSLHDGHDLEAMFYALVSTLRFGTAPYRSTVFSVASGDWTDPDVSPAKLRETAKSVVDAVNRYVDVMLERRPATLTADRWCSWCPARSSCPAAAEAKAAGGSSTRSGAKPAQAQPVQLAAGKPPATRQSKAKASPRSPGGAVKSAPSVFDIE